MSMEECKFDALNKLQKTWCKKTNTPIIKKNDQAWIEEALEKLIWTYEWDINELSRKELELEIEKTRTFRKKTYDIEQCKLWHEKLPKEECKYCDEECDNAKKEADQD